MSTMLPHLERLVSGHAPPPPIADALDVRMTAVAPGAATFEMDVDGRFANPMGTLHGGIFSTLADSAMGMAYLSLLDEGETFTTLELKINFLKPVRRGRLTATGHVVKAGRTIGLTECDVCDERGDLVARASSTCMTLRGDAAKGR